MRILRTIPEDEFRNVRRGGHMHANRTLPNGRVRLENR